MSDVRDDVALFADRVLGQPLWPHQVAAARSEAFVTVIAKARRTGGSELAETLAMWTAFRERDVRVLFLSATQDSARQRTESIGAKLARSPLTRGAVVDAQAMRVRLANRSEIVSLPASQRQVRGYGKGVRLVVLDEAGFMPSELWAAAHYTALDERPRSRVLMLGTPWGSVEHFFRRSYLAGVEGDPDFAAFHWTYEVNPRLDRAYMERLRHRVSPAEYLAEALGEWSDAVGALFRVELLERQTADIVVPDLAALRPPARGAVGVDWGVSFDRSAAVAVFRLPVAGLNPDREPVPTFVALPYVWAAGTRLDRVVEAVVAASPAFRFLAPELNGVGEHPTQRLMDLTRARGERSGRQWVPVRTTAQSKTLGYGAILSLLERGQLVLPRDPDLLRQLAGLRFEQGERGFTRIGAGEEAVHDDVADALYLATLPYRPGGGGRLISGLAHFAGSSRPDAVVPELDEPVVTTGDGLRVYRRPALQSVSGGPDVSLPAGVSEWRAPEDPRLERIRAAARAAARKREEAHGGR